MLYFDRQTFYSYIRRAPFGGQLTPQQFSGVEQLLKAWERYGVDDPDPRNLAYILAGVFHETGGRMVPVREGFASSDSAARAAVARLYAQGRISRNYALPVNGVSYYGRGRIQNTHHENYVALSKRFNLPFDTDPDILIRDGETDAMVTVIGHIEGIWTKGKHTLGKYFNDEKDDPVGARRIVNGTDKSQLISQYHHNFLDALKEAVRVYDLSYKAAVETVGHPEDADASLQEEKAVDIRPADVSPEAARPDTPDLKRDKITIGTVIASLSGVGGLGALAPVLQHLNNPWVFAFLMTLVLIGVGLIVVGRMDLRHKKGA